MIDTGIEVKHIKAYVQKNGIIRLDNGKKEGHFLGRLMDGISYYEIEEVKFNPWDCVPDESVKIGHYIRKLSIDSGRMHWQINEYYGTTIEDKIGCMVAAGYNCDVSRDGETKIFKDGSWRNYNG